MSTAFMFKRTQPAVSRDAVLNHPLLQNRLLVSRDDEAKGLSVETTEAVGVMVYDLGAVWLTFTDKRVDLLEVFGASSSTAVYALAEEMGWQVVSEHETDFSYHEFPVDTKTDKPHYVHNGWEGYIVQGWVFPYYRPTNSYFIHAQYEDTTLEQFVAVVNALTEEYDIN